jgi:4-amino-4-deoxy-L-arabinose transferase-like glycosyltransferase
MPRPVRIPSDRRERILLGAILAVAALLRLYRLDSPLWIDEVDAVLTSLRRPAAEILTSWPVYGSHVLYDLCAWASVYVLGESAFSVRLPAALFGIAGVYVFTILAREIVGWRHGLVAGALLAVSYHHVFQSQNARGYGALLFFGLTATLVLVRAQRRGAMGPATGAAYAFAAALAAYSIVLGAFVPAGHGAAVAGLGRSRRNGGRLSLQAFLPWGFLAALLTALAYAPFAPEVVQLAEHQTTVPSGAATGAAYRLHFLAEAARGLAAGLLGPAGLAVGAVFASIGAVDLWRRNAFALAALVGPTAVQLPVLLATVAPLSPRYFAFALPAATLASAHGLAIVVRAIADRRPSPLVEAGLLGACILASALPLIGYYRVPKQDYPGALAWIAAHASPRDARVALHYAAHVLDDYHQAGLLRPRSVAQLEVIERSSERVWLVTTLESHLAVQRPDFYGHVRNRYRLVVVLPATVRDGEMRLYVNR